ncbi:MAG: ClbS/DfsB family four-helix bundle protein [Chloroflexota bacterium]|nr:ClbS/DfsB family four-helix bundle protein [Chloroflexota bacterium]MDQ5867143.1 ClbS/DfsB family four-helix bundle protein [Chloroflexota bacterium]
MDAQIDKATLLDRVRSERSRLDSLLAGFTDEQMARPGVDGAWSLKDHLAHITWHEREMVNMLRARSLEEGVSSDLWGLPLHERNRAIYESNRHRSLEDVRAESRQMYAELSQLLEDASEEDLTDPGRYKGMPGDWKPWRLIAENTYEHYHDHTEDLALKRET